MEAEGWEGGRKTAGPVWWSPPWPREYAESFKNVCMFL